MYNLGSTIKFRASLNLIVEPRLYMLLRFQKPAVRENCATGDQALSMRLRSHQPHRRSLALEPHRRTRRRSIPPLTKRAHPSQPYAYVPATTNVLTRWRREVVHTATFWRHSIQSRPQGLENQLLWILYASM